jgi:hypothetical protein
VLDIEVELLLVRQEKKREKKYLKGGISRGCLA